MKSVRDMYTEEKFFEDCEKLIKILSGCVEIKEGEQKATIKPDANMYETLEHVSNFAINYLGLDKTKSHHVPKLSTEDSELKTMFFFFNYALIDCLGKFVSYKESVMDMENIMKKSPIIESAAKETIEQIKEKTDVINKSSTDLYNLLNGIVKTKKPKAGGARQ